MTNWEDILKMPFDVPQQQEQSFQANDGFLIKWAEIYLDDRLKNYIQQETIQGKHRIQILDNQGKKEFGRLVSRLGLPRIEEVLGKEYNTTVKVEYDDNTPERTAYEGHNTDKVIFEIGE